MVEVINPPKEKIQHGALEIGKAMKNWVKVTVEGIKHEVKITAEELKEEV